MYLSNILPPRDSPPYASKATPLPERALCPGSSETCCYKAARHRVPLLSPLHYPIYTLWGLKTEKNKTDKNEVSQCPMEQYQVDEYVHK